MKKPYRIFAAISEETNAGWIWFGCPALPTRTIVRVWHPKNRRFVYCESRKIDDNFVTKYNQPSRRHIDKKCEALIISEWYRNALGGFSTGREYEDQVTLEIKPAQIPVWRSLRACCHHPDIAVRVGTRLGVLATWLGIVALMAALPKLNSFYRVSFLIAVAIVGAILGILACLGVKPPTSR